MVSFYFPEYFVGKVRAGGPLPVRRASPNLAGGTSAHAPAAPPGDLTRRRPPWGPRAATRLPRHSSGSPRWHLPPVRSTRARPQHSPRKAAAPGQDGDGRCERGCGGEGLRVLTRAGGNRGQKPLAELSRCPPPRRSRDTAHRQPQHWGQT